MCCCCHHHPEYFGEEKFPLVRWPNSKPAPRLGETLEVGEGTGIFAIVTEIRCGSDHDRKVRFSFQSLVD